MIKARDIFGAFLSGTCLIAVFPKLQLAWLAWVALVPLLLAIEDKPAPSAFRLGLISGLVYFLGTIYWIPHTLEYYGKLPVLLSWFVLLVLAAFLALFIGGFAWSVNYCRGRLFLPVLAAVSWVSFEYLRTYVLTGFPWALLGYSQVPNLAMIQVAEFGGVYGISFWVVLVNAAVAGLLTACQKKQRLPWRWGLSVLIFSVLCFAYGKRQLSLPGPAASMKVAAIQGNIPQDKKWDQKYQEEVFQVYNQLSLEAARKDAPQLLIWPEAATPFYFQSDKIYRPRILQLAIESKSYLLFGSPGYKRVVNKIRPFNGAYLLNPAGEEVAGYQKIHLVPFGEYVPLEQIFSFAGKLVAQAGNFVSGKEYSLLPMKTTQVGTVICYEIIFPDLVRRFVKRGAGVLVNITNDAWFGKTAAPYQHFAMLSMRAVENRRYIVRAANTGISGFFDPWGRVLKQGGLFTREYLVQDIAPQSGLTFYSRYGDLLAISCLLLLITAVAINYEKGNKCKKNCFKK